MAILLAATVAAASLILLAGGCSRAAPLLGRSGDELVPDAALAADLDGDGVYEEILVDGDGRLVIRDGATVYHNRDKWRVVEAALGDTDRNGLLEVVTLLEADDGRHLGLFAYMGGEYRERLVTAVLDPRPLALEVVAGDAGAAGGSHTAGAGDLLILTEEASPGRAGSQTTTYRWNGFGFTALDL